MKIKKIFKDEPELYKWVQQKPVRAIATMSYRRRPSVLGLNNIWLQIRVP
jgi:hypothetical protein